jgi:hypothetical protein
MTTHSERRSLDDDLALIAPQDAPLAVRVLAVEVASEEGRITRVRLRVRVTPEGYRRVDEQALLNLRPDVRGESVAGLPLADSQPVIIEAELRPDVLLRAAPQLRTAGALWDHLRAASGGAGHALLSTESWYALSVSQPLPNETEGGAAVAAPGYRTLWAEIGPPRVGIKATEQPLSSALASWFQGQDWPIQRGRNPLLLRTRYKGTHGSWEVQARAFEDLRTVVFYSICPNRVGPSERPAVAELCARANCEMLVGNLQMDWDSGEVRLRTSLDLESDVLSPNLINQLVAANVLQLDRLLPALSSVISGESPPATALAQVPMTRRQAEDA